ncbi:MAG TPA: hypothetical protein VHG71_04905 [Verrucomicrobiae bacterium]|nr:hypothetical protein [Verrucomicrobiae bacterium]
MAVVSVHSLRINRLELRRFVLVLALSLAAHLSIWGSYELGKKLNLWQAWHWPAWLHHLEKTKPLVTQNTEEPLTFVEVDQPSTEVPKDAKYYSSHNSQAANPDTKEDSKNPQINGKQIEVAKTENVPKPNFSKLQPNPQQPSEQANSGLKEGDLIMGKPSPQPQEKPDRPRTLKEALAQNHLPGVQMRQSGGVHRQSLVPSLDVKATPFGAYDEAIIEAVQQRWDDLLDSQQFSRDRTGKVTLRFHLNYDGRVTDMQVVENTVGDLLGYVCQKAIEDPAPFAPWPGDMRRMVGENYREITFTFYYY